MSESPRDLAVAWRLGLHARVCDRTERSPTGVAVYATEFPDYYDFNTLRVEDADADAAAIAAEADRLYAGFDHRKAEVFDAALGARLEPDLQRLGWHSQPLVWMLHTNVATAVAPELRPDPASDAEVRPLRLSWVEPPHTPAGVAAHLPIDEEVGRRLGARNLVLRDASGEPVAYTRYLLLDGQAEVLNVFVAPERRGRGLGAALTTATVAAARDDGAEHVFILADARGRPRELYARLGFSAVWEPYDFVKILREPV